jgi:hypothetical protein
MGRSLGDLFWRITGDTSQFDKSVKDTRTEAQKLDKDATKSFGSIKLSSIAMGVATSAVFIKTIGFLKDSAIAAINAQETFSKFDVVFSQMGSAAESAAMQFKDSFDLAEVTAKKMIADTGNILTGFGATQSQALDLSVAVNSLGADLASFTNYTGGAEGASQALTRAMLGERESLKLLGIVIREEDINVKLAAKGQKDLTGNALNLAKAQATLEIATEQGKNAIGDYARTHDSASNTLKRAKEATTELQVQIGTALSPSVSLLGDLWGTVATELAKVIQKRNELRDAEKAAGTEEDTTEKKIIRLQEEDKLLSQRIAKAKQYSQYVTAESIKESEVYQKAIQSKIKGLQLQMQFENAASNQKEEAQRRVEEWNASNEKKEADELEHIKSIAEEKKAINDEYLAQAEELNWKVSEGLMTEIEERDALRAAAEDQIQSLYDLYVKTGDQSILSSEAMLQAIANTERFGDTVTDVSELAVINLKAITELGMKRVVTGFEDIGEAIAAGSAGWNDFAKMAFKAFAAVIRAIAAELFALAWTNVLEYNYAQAAIGFAESAAAYTAAGVVEGYAGQFANGGIVPGDSYTGDKLIARVNSGEEIITADDPRHSNNAGKEISITVNTILDGEIVAKNTAKYYNDGRVRLNV